MHVWGQCVQDSSHKGPGLERLSNCQGPAWLEQVGAWRGRGGSQEMRSESTKGSVLCRALKTILRMLGFTE